MDDARVGDTSIAAAVPVMLVPRVPGPLLTVDLVMGRPRDDLDILIDDLFGEPVQERSGVMDAVLIAAGLAMLLWTFLGASPVVAVLGVIALVLGLALPTRDALRRIRGRRVAARMEQAQAQGMLLDVSSPETRRLADRYADLLASAGSVAGSDGASAAAAGHLAVTEVASLLHGAPPRAAAQVEYVERRTEAIRDLTEALRTSLRRAAARAEAERAGQLEAAADEAARVTTAREELDSVGGLGSLEQLDALATQVRGRSADAAA